MCRRFKLLYGIEEATSQEIIDYLRRLWRVYLILLALTVLQVAISYNDLYWNIATIVLYVVNIASLYALIRTPCIKYTYLPMLSSSLLAALDSIQMVYQIVTDSEWLALLRLIPIFIQLTTIYIAFKLREKMNSDAVPDLEEAIMVGNPVQRHSYAKT